MLVELVLDAGVDGIIGFEVFLTIEVLRCVREVSFAQSTTKSHEHVSSWRQHRFTHVDRFCFAGHFCPEYVFLLLILLARNIIHH